MKPIDDDLITSLVWFALGFGLGMTAFFLRMYA